MTSLQRLKRDIETVKRALLGEYDEAGYDDTGHDRYGRSRELMEKAAREHQAAFDSLTTDQQAFVLKSYEIGRKYEQKAVEWERQPEAMKQQAPFYNEYRSHSDITKHAFLFGVWASEEEDKLCLEAASSMIRARNKLFPPTSSRSVH